MNNVTQAKGPLSGVSRSVLGTIWTGGSNPTRTASRPGRPGLLFVTQVMDHENCYLRYKSDCARFVYRHDWAGASKANRNGVQIRVVQLVSPVKRNASVAAQPFLNRVLT